LWPDCVADRDIEGFEAESVAVVDDIVSLGKSMGLEVDNADMEELVEDHRNGLTTEELEHLQKEQQKTVKEEMSSETGEGREDVPSSSFYEMG
jgi:hypothetical protein